MAHGVPAASAVVAALDERNVGEELVALDVVGLGAVPVGDEGGLHVHGLDRRVGEPFALAANGGG
eukprot:15420686-Alexandrium_andersonii.AAC.1